MAITLVQHKFNSGAAAATSIAVTITPNSANNLIIVVAGASPSTGTISGVADNATGGSNVYTQAAAARATDAGGNTFVDVWHVLQAARGGATTVTITFSASMASQDAWVFEVSGFTTAALDIVGTVNNGVSAGGADTGASVTTTSATGFIVGGDLTGTSVTANPLAGNEFTSGGDIDANTNAACSLISTTAAAHQPQWGTNSASFTSTTVAFKETASGVAPGFDISGIEASLSSPSWLPEVDSIFLPLVSTDELYGYLYPLAAISQGYGIDEGVFTPLPPPIQPSAEDDFISYLSGWQTHVDDLSGFALIPPPIQPSAEDDFVYSLGTWIPHDIDISGFVPGPPPIQPSAEYDHLQYFAGWPQYVDDTSGFAPLPPLTQPSVEDDFMFSLSPGSLAAFVDMAELGFVQAPAGPGTGLYYWYGVWPQ